MKKSILFIALAFALLLLGCTSSKPLASNDPSESPETETPAPIIPAVTEAADDSAFFAAVTDFILNGQQELPEAERILWSESFLKALDFAPLYESYLAAGGDGGDEKAFASYITENAPIPENWKALFEQDLLNGYGKTVERYEELDNDMYQVYVIINNESVPYVAVNCRTGWYHG